MKTHGKDTPDVVLACDFAGVSSKVRRRLQWSTSRGIATASLMDTLRFWQLPLSMSVDDSLDSLPVLPHNHVRARTSCNAALRHRCGPAESRGGTHPGTNAKCLIEFPGGPLSRSSIFVACLWLSTDTPHQLQAVHSERSVPFHCWPQARRPNTGEMSLRELSLLFRGRRATHCSMCTFARSDCRGSVALARPVVYKQSCDRAEITTPGRKQEKCVTPAHARFNIVSSS